MIACLIQTSIATAQTSRSTVQIDGTAFAKTEVTVTAIPGEVKGEIPTQTISGNTVRDTPNQNERTESVLALVPGVVRGPDGRINIGARNTQSGAAYLSALMLPIRPPAAQL
jgi:hypothetical protein